MCGGMRHEEERQAPPPRQDFTYTPPDLRSLYNQFRETGQVPYSYYGVGAPTREGELEAMRGSYPGAFSTPSAPPQMQRPVRPQPQQAQPPFLRLFGALGGSGR